MMKSKKVTNDDGIEVEITFECGKLHFNVNNHGNSTKSGDLHTALKHSEVPPKMANLFVRDIKQALGL